MYFSEFNHHQDAQIQDHLSVGLSLMGFFAVIIPAIRTQACTHTPTSVFKSFSQIPYSTQRSWSSLQHRYKSKILFQS